MDVAVLATLFLTGFCALSSSFPNAYNFIEEEMTWYEAQKYCNSENTAMAQIQNVEDATAMYNTPTGAYRDKAWIGLFAYDSEWTWVEGHQPWLFNGLNDQPHTDKRCLAINTDDESTAANCSDKKPFLCYDGLRSYLNESLSTWNDAKTSCEHNGRVLGSILPINASNEVSSAFGKEAAWVGVYRRKLWVWSESGENIKFMNWQNGHPDDLNGSDNCTAVALTDGSWTDEQCDAKYPFFCRRARRKTVVRMKIHSSKNMEDPAHSAALLQQLSAALAQQGLTDFQLTWKKLPEKIQVNESSTRCLMTP